MSEELLPGAAVLGVAIVGGVFGSGHCVGMCGPFAGFAGTLRRGAWDASVAYQLGRLTAYLSLGVVAGLASEALAQLASMLEVQRALALLTGASLVAVGLVTLLGSQRAGRLGRVGQLWARVVGELTAVARAAGPRTGPYLLGMSASLLPCGFLYSFALAAAATGSMTGALMTMAGFWIGTAPALVAATWLAGRVGQGLFRHARRMVGVTLIVLGILGVAVRWGRDPGPSGEPACCHCAQNEPGG